MHSLVNPTCENKKKKIKFLHWFIVLFIILLNIDSLFNSFHYHINPNLWKIRKQFFFTPFYWIINLMHFIILAPTLLVKIKKKKISCTELSCSLFIDSMSLVKLMHCILAPTLLVNIRKRKALAMTSLIIYLLIKYSHIDYNQLHSWTNHHL